MKQLRQCFYLAGVNSITIFILVGLILDKEYTYFAPVAATVVALLIFFTPLYNYNVRLVESPIPHYRLYTVIGLTLLFYVIFAVTIIPIAVLNNIKGEMISTIIYISIIFFMGYYTAPEILEEIDL